MFVTPFALSHSTTHCRSGFPPTFTSPFGKSAVIGLSRIPSPPDRTTAVLGKWVDLCNPGIGHLILQTGYKRSTLMHRRWRTSVRARSRKSNFLKKEFLFFF